MFTRAERRVASPRTHSSARMKPGGREDGGAGERELSPAPNGGSSGLAPAVRRGWNLATANRASAPGRQL